MVRKVSEALSHGHDMVRACQVLVVEDDADLASSLKDVLGAQAYGVEVARDGQRALAACRSQRFDVALVDIRLPDCDGVELAGRLAEVTPATEFIIMTGYPSLESAAASVKQRRIVGYETKPLDLNHLRLLMEQVVARREAEDAARDSSRRWKVTFDSVSDAVCLADPEGRILQCNEAMGRLVGKPVNEVVGVTCWELVHGAAGPTPDCPLQRMKESRHRETSVLPEGDRWFEITADPLVDESGTLTGAVHVMRDITSWKRAEEAVLRERDLAQKYLDVAGVMLVALDSGGTVTMANRKACEVLGCGEDEVVGKDWIEEFVPEKGRKEVRRVFDQLVAGETGAVEDYENAVVTKRGEERLIAWRNTVVMADGGRVVGTLSSGEDIGERRTVEDEVRLKAQLLDAANDSIFLHDRGWKLKYANESAWRCRGYTREKLMGMTLDDLFGAEEAKRCRKWIRSAAKRGEARFESTHRCKDGSVMPVEVRARAVESDGETLILSVARDISITKRAQEKLEEANKILARAVEGTTQAFEMAIEMRDPYTAGHQIRATKLACAIAKEMRLPEARIEVLRVAAAIHDVGKMYVPAEILSRPGALTEAEFSMIKAHPRAGFDILKAADASSPVADIVLQHHERIDGSGYPIGLSGDRIMIEARILAVADVVEAMSSHRPYRPAHSEDKALVEIMQKRGVLYDCDAVDACLVLFTQKGYCFDQARSWRARNAYRWLPG